MNNNLIEIDGNVSNIVICQVFPTFVAAECLRKQTPIKSLYDILQLTEAKIHEIIITKNTCKESVVFYQSCHVFSSLSFFMMFYVFMFFISSLSFIYIVKESQNITYVTFSIGLSSTHALEDLFHKIFSVDKIKKYFYLIRYPGN